MLGVSGAALNARRPRSTGLARVRCVAPGVVALVLIVGCTGRANLEVIPLRFDAIDPPKPFATRIALNSCSWFERADGRIEIAVQQRRKLLFGPVDEFSFELSLQLEKLPSGKARFYNVRKRELRALARLGPLQGRYVSASGIVVLYRPENGVLRGSFRILAAREVAQFLGGFSKPTQTLMQGAFTAVLDEDRTRAIVAETESDGFERDPPPRVPTSNPTN